MCMLLYPLYTIVKMPLLPHTATSEARFYNMAFFDPSPWVAYPRVQGLDFRSLRFGVGLGLRVARDEFGESGPLHRPEVDPD